MRTVRMFLIIMSLSLGWAIAPGILSAEERLSLPECIELGLKNSKMLHSALMKSQYSQARLQEARAQRFPSLSLSASYNRLSKEGPSEISLPVPISLGPEILDTWGLSVGFSQSLFNGFRIKNSIAKSQDFFAESRFSYQRTRQSLSFDIQVKYWNLIRAEELIKVIQENISRIKVHLQDVKALFSQGMVTYNEVLKVEMQLAASELLRIEAANNQKLARARLNILLGLSHERKLKLEVHFEAGAKHPESLEVLLERALNLCPDVGALKGRIQAQDAALKVVRSGWYPYVFLTGNYAYARPNPRLFPPEDKFESTWELGVAARIDVGGYSSLPAKITQAESALSQAQDALESLKEAIILDVIQCYLDLNKVGEQIEVAEKMSRQAEENFRIITEQFNSGLSLTSELLDAEQALLEARLNLTQSRIDREIAWAALERATGMPAWGSKP